MIIYQKFNIIMILNIFIKFFNYILRIEQNFILKVVEITWKQEELIIMIPMLLLFKKK